MMLPPVVYVGPTLHSDEVSDLLPRAQVMPPVRRGDLYRDRLLGFDVLVILDGVFHQELAVSPREVIDIVQDGATVVGASSMGALRAAECWPVGMRGVGSIYRMYRRGHLRSDDDVAVTFYPMPPYAAATVPLINIRYAVSRAVRSGLMPPETAQRIVEVARGRHFSSRTWNSILDAAGITDVHGLSAALGNYDLKRLDAQRALRWVRRWVESGSHRATRHASSARRFSDPGRREASHEGVRDHDSRVMSAEVWRWLVATGRYRRYIRLVVADAHVAGTPTPNAREGAPWGPDDDAEALALAEGRGTLFSGLGISHVDIANALASERTTVTLLDALAAHDDALARQTWSQVAAVGDLDAVLLRFTTISDAASWARAQAWQPDSRHRSLARAEIASSHGFRTWEDLAAMLAASPVVWPWIEHACSQLALAKRVRQELFTRVSLGAPLPNPGRSKPGGQP